MSNRPELLDLALTRIAWLLVAILVAGGSAGIVASVGGPTGVGEHPELTSAGDRAIEPGFARALADLDVLSAQVDQLGLQGRGALAALAARDQVHLQATITDGSKLVDSINDHAIAIRGRLRTLPGVNGAGPPLPASAAVRLGPKTVARYGALDTALTSTAGLSDAWVKLTSGSLAAIRLQTVLADHETSTAAAAREGRGGHYDAAAEQLERSKALIADASKQRDTLQNTVDVTILTRWLQLNANYDAALAKLYDVLRRSNGRATKDVRAALEAEAKAHEQLPPDTRALVVIMAEIARGGLNQAVISIEEARGELAAAVAALSASPGASPEPSASSPAPSSSPAAGSTSASPAGS